MADNYSAVGTNALKLVGDGASGVGPYTKFGTVILTAVKVTSSSVDFTTTPAAANSNYIKQLRLYKWVQKCFTLVNQQLQVVITLLHS